MIKSYFLLAIIYSMLVSSCGKKHLTLADLPPATQKGLNTFGCLVNGAVYIDQSGNGILVPQGSNFNIYYYKESRE